MLHPYNRLANASLPAFGDALTPLFWARLRGHFGMGVAGSESDSEERPSAGDAFEFVFAPVLERVLGGTEEVGDGS
jgi:hypothetical protein